MSVSKRFSCCVAVLSVAQYLNRGFQNLGHALVILRCLRWQVDLSLIKLQFNVRGSKQSAESEEGEKLCVPLENGINTSLLHAICRLILLFF